MRASPLCTLCIDGEVHVVFVCTKCSELRYQYIYSKYALMLTK